MRHAEGILRHEGHKAEVIGVSDGYITEKWAKRKFGRHYKNFHYHKEPSLDLVTIEAQYFAMANIAICSEVLEHVEPPVHRAFTGLAAVLATGGFLVISVPYTTSGTEHVEHFEELLDGHLDNSPNGFAWTGKNAEGTERRYTELIFHGGIGSTLEFRVFSEKSLRDNLTSAGFSLVKIMDNHRLSGISWEPWSRVWLVRKN